LASLTAAATSTSTLRASSKLFAFDSSGLLGTSIKASPSTSLKSVKRSLGCLIFFTRYFFSHNKTFLLFISLS